ncbi:hypothetical protein HZH66_001006 [Vespula vulgaris]|uniref:Uncharacterized protein n=2 Tax=Vespula TaxID=7451 RepID=A0A834NJ58_VESVU|nr:hypothetical protein HZH66_001006 [Vespula vulgaris]
MIENWSQIISDKEACEIARRVWSECHKVLKNDAKEIEIKKRRLVILYVICYTMVGNDDPSSSIHELWRRKEQK